mmetsp:Transcript_1702/g.3544  ORF Transcript_1702/g.3544 Transcript_1702/m.3544 type:complete len:360 (-) Transcript_1702:1443-2522(-)
MSYDYKTVAAELKGRSFLTLLDFTPDQIRFMLDLSAKLKTRKQQARELGVQGNLFTGKNVVLIFDKGSTRTRCSFEVAVQDEGGGVTFLSGSHMGKKESVEDTAKVLGQLYDGIEFRGYAQADVEALAKFSGVPVWNGLTDEFHPTQALADFLTARECLKKPYNEMKVVYIGDAANNVAYSLMICVVKLGGKFVALGPKERSPDPALVAKMEALGKETGGTVEVYDITERKTALAGADVLYTDVWVSMGEEDLFAERIALLKDYQVDMSMIADTNNPDCIFLHCLPAFHDTETAVGKEVKEKFGLDAMECSDELFRSKHCAAFQQAGNRLHTIKAVMVCTIGHLLKRAPNSLDDLDIKE